MKKVLALIASIASATIIMSCASSGIAAVDTTINEQNIDITSMKREDYIILGYVSGEGSIVASDKLIANQRSGTLPTRRMNLKNDTFRYGYTSSIKPYAMTVEETAIANATYKMIKQAETNGADTVAFVQTHVSIIPKLTEKGKQSFFDPESTVTAKVTGIAIKIKNEVPALQPAPVSEAEDLDPVATFKYQKTNAEKLAREKAEAELDARRKALKEQKEKEAAAAADDDKASETQSQNPSESSDTKSSDTPAADNSTNNTKTETSSDISAKTTTTGDAQ